MINKYESIPTIIEAVKWSGGNYQEIREFVGENAYIKNGILYIHTLEGDMQARISDYIVKGVLGEFYPCRNDAFNKKYRRK